jgi:hypothetical protein
VADFRDTPESDQSSGFGSGLLLYAACAAVAVFVGWPIIKGAFPDSFPVENRGGATTYDEYGYTGDPGRFDRWRNADRGGPREYSPYFPGPRTQQPQGPGAGFEVASRQRGVEQGDYAASPGSVRRAPETYGSARSPGPQYQQQGQYRQQFRECGGAWWNPLSEAGCGALQNAPPPDARRR